MSWLEGLVTIVIFVAGILTIHIFLTDGEPRK